MPRVRVADPDETARLMDVEVSLDGDFAVAELPQFAVWQLVVIEVTP
jgi:dextranase